MNYSTKKAAKLAGISRDTLIRWTNAGVVKPSQILKHNARENWIWSERDVQRIIRYAAAHKFEGRGRKPKK